MLATASPVLGQASTPFEVMHWWVSPSETAALSVIRARFAAKGGTWVDLPAESAETVRRKAVERIADGKPPGAVQWLAGAALRGLARYGLLRPTEPIARADGWHEAMFPFVADLTGRDGKFLAVPVTIHGENWAWYNKPIYDGLGLSIPASWDEFLAQAPTIRDAGYLPLATGPGWQLRILFTSVLIGVAGPEAYRRLVVERDIGALRTAQVRRAFEVFARLRALAGRGSRSWADATAMLATGRAAALFTGDWAKGELMAYGLVPGRDFACRLAPAPRPAYVAVVDMFVLGAGEQPGLHESQDLFARTVAEPAVQLGFARAKGSIPARRDLAAAAADLDPCARLAVQTVTRAGAVLPSVNAFEDPILTALQETVEALWADPGLGPEAAIAGMLRRIEGR